jgi:hypothetical protein
MRRFYLFIVAISIAAAALRIASASPTAIVIGPGFYDDRHPVIDYSFVGGGWNVSSCTNANFYFGTCSYTTTINESATINFTGDGITIYSYKASDEGEASFCVDGNCVNNNLFNATPIYKFAVIFTGLGYGDHVAIITKTDSTSELVAIDAILVHAELPQPTFDFSDIQIEVTLELTLEVAPPAWINEFTVPDGEGGEQNVAFSYEVTAGDLSQVILIAATLIAVLVLLVVTVRGST